ncbi:uncharacterized protein LOC123548603 [Mercenaria mercenaria]|uniref:uncharacterized protein LOC123548603 n=1 Tax=Mercenaria mercenaria TaxID=6596 RepID=UPI00234F321D|nr:uncharacterized protein LOC123548603 [Mercenaria mercenaria]
MTCIESTTVIPVIIMETGPSTASMKETNISTFVFLDFESTSLLDRKCRITELCLLAVNRVDMNEAGNFPRVTNKLTLCLDPQTPISMTSSNITGLYNDSLENQKALTEETVALINSFLNHLSKPVCLLAHNGNRFDFPLLVSELKRINQSLDSLLLCADTLEAFRSLDGLPAKYDPLSNQNTGKKYQNSPNKSQVTPAKSANSSTNSLLKRKGTQDLDALNDQSPKVSKQHPSGDMKLSAEKVKKKLNFEKVASDIENDTEQTNDAYVNNNATANKGEIVEEFSASLEDEDYLFALENAEKELCKETLVFGKSENEHVTEKFCNDTKHQNEDKNSTSSSVSNPAGCATLSEPCCIANGTGYYVRQNTNESLTMESGDSLLKRFKTNGNDTAASAESVNQSTSSAICVSRTVNHLKDTVSTNGTKTQVSCTKTNFVVTLRPNQNSPLPVQISDSIPRNNSTKATEAACNSSEPVSSTSDMRDSSNSESKSVSTANELNSSKSESTHFSLANASGSSKSVSVPFSAADEASSSKSGSTLVSHTDVSGSLKSGLKSDSAKTTHNSSISGATPIPAANTLSSLKSKPVSGADTQNGSPNFQRQSYKLGEVYLRKFGSRPPQSHKAEDDCITMLKIAKFSPGFMEWVDKNAILLSTIPSPF